MSENEFFTLDQELIFRFVKDGLNEKFQLIEKGKVVLEARKKIKTRTHNRVDGQ